MNLKKWMREEGFDNLTLSNSDGSPTSDGLRKFSRKVGELLQEYPLAMLPSQLDQLIGNNQYKLRKGEMYIGKKISRVGRSATYKIFYITDPTPSILSQGARTRDTMYVTLKFSEEFFVGGPKGTISWIKALRDSTKGDSSQLGTWSSKSNSGQKYVAWIPLQMLYINSSTFINWIGDNPMEVNK